MKAKWKKTNVYKCGKVLRWAELIKEVLCRKVALNLLLKDDGCWTGRGKRRREQVVN